jgi:hypothetical protein
LTDLRLEAAAVGNLEGQPPFDATVRIAARSP